MEIHRKHIYKLYMTSFACFNNYEYGNDAFEVMSDTTLIKSVLK